ncbi:MAG: cytochrome P450 [Thermomicrobiales bacterium]
MADIDGRITGKDAANPVATEVPVFRLETAFAVGDPYATYDWFRANNPIHTGEPREWGPPPVYLFRHDDVIKWLRDARLGKEWQKLSPPDAAPSVPERDSFQAVARQFMLFRDPLMHTHLRGLANLAFAPRQVEQLRPHIQQVATSLIGELRERETEDSIDLIANFAYPLPTLVIAHILGIPTADFRRFRQWAGDIAAAIDFPLEGLQEFVARVDQTTRELSDYLRWIFAQRKANPQDDLISRLIHADADGGQLDEEQVIGTCILLLVAGHETTVNLIGNGTRALLRHPEQWQMLVKDPDLARTATEELLRFDSPVQLTTRIAYEEIELGRGVVIPPGTELHYLLGSANRDAAVFADPANLDITRDVGRIMSFGMGIHFCLGSQLARLEGEIAFSTLARELPHLSLATDQQIWRPGAVLHGLRDLPVRTHP